MDWRERITVDPEVLAGKPVVRGTRLSVESAARAPWLEGWTVRQVLANYPNVGIKMSEPALAYAAEVLRDETTYPMPA